MTARLQWKPRCGDSQPYRDGNLRTCPRRRFDRQRSPESLGENTGLCGVQHIFGPELRAFHIGWRSRDEHALTGRYTAVSGEVQRAHTAETDCQQPRAGRAIGGSDSISAEPSGSRIGLRNAQTSNNPVQPFTGTLMLSKSRPRVSGTTNRTKTSVTILSVP